MRDVPQVQNLRDVFSIWYSRCFHIFQVQLQRSPPIVFIGFEVIQNIHTRGQGGFQRSHAEADAINRRAAIIFERQLQMPAFCTDRARKFNFHIP